VKPQSKSIGLFPILAMVVLGWLLIALPGHIISKYHEVSAVGGVWAVLYAGAVALGCLLLAVTAVWVACRVWAGTRRARQQREERPPRRAPVTEEQKRDAVAQNVAEAQQALNKRGVAPEDKAQGQQAATELQRKSEQQTLEIVAFGTISSGKSALLNALAGHKVFESDVAGGTTTRRGEVPMTGLDRVMLVDTPGLGEVRGQRHGEVARREAANADLVLFVIDGPLKSFEFETLEVLAQLGKRVLVCFNKQDWYSERDRQRMLGQIHEQIGKWVAAQDVLPVRALPTKRTRVRVLPDGSEVEEQVEVPRDITELANRLLDVITQEGKELLLANLLLRSQGLLVEARERAMKALDGQAQRLVERYMWQAGGLAAINPVPFLDVATGLVMAAKMVLDLAKIYERPMDLAAAKRLLGELSKNFIAMGGAAAAAPLIGTAVGSMVKVIPGLGTVTGGAIQGLTQALVIKWTGRVFIEYFHTDEAAADLRSLAHGQWEQLTKPAALIELVQAGWDQVTSGSGTPREKPRP
jgi:uncharacterized protein